MFKIKAIALFGAIKRSKYMESTPKGRVIIAPGSGISDIKLITGNNELRSVINLNTESQVFIDEPICFDAQPIIGLLSVLGDSIVECKLTKTRISFTDVDNKKNKASAPIYEDRFSIANAVELISEIDKQKDFVASLSAADWNRLKIAANFASEPEKINFHSVYIQVKDKSIAFLSLDGYMMGYMWGDGFAVGQADPFLIQPKAVMFNAYDKVVCYKNRNVFIEHGQETVVVPTINMTSSFPASKVMSALSDSSIKWHMILDSMQLSERISAVGRVDYYQNPSQIRIRSNGNEVTIESIESLADQNVAMTMTNQQESDFSFVLASKYLQKALSYLKSGSDNSQNVLIGESGEATIVFATSNMSGRFGFARMHDPDGVKNG